MRSLCIFALCMLLAAPAAAQHKDTKPGPTARQLFNGRDLAGWQHAGPGRFVVEDGLLRSEGGMGLLWYMGEKFGNCVIRVVYKTTSRLSNSGVFVRIADKPAEPWYAVHHGYEVQIQDDNDEYHRTGAVYSLAPSKAGAANPPGQWNVMEIALRGARILVTLNGLQVTDFDPGKPAPERTQPWEPERGPRPESGYVGLQNHSAQDAVFFKEVSVRPL